MAWLYKQDGSANWWIGYRINGRQILRSTKTSDKKEAEKQLQNIETLASYQNSDGVLDELYQALKGQRSVKVTLKGAADAWLSSCQGATASGTFERYDDVIGAFLDYFNANDKAPLIREITGDMVNAFLSSRLATHAKSTLNHERRVLSVFFTECTRRGHITVNPVKATKRFKVAKSEASVRRAFDTEELRSAFRAAAHDPFWRYMVCGGTYTGLRLGDLACLRRKEIDLGHNQLSLVVTKTGETIHIPLAAPFRALLEARLRQLGRGKGDDYLWPEHARLYVAQGSPPLSNDFYEKVLVPAGLAEKRSHKKQKERKAGPRKMNPLSFHSFRHSFVSLLKMSGASQHVAKELAGHSSDAVSDIYTTIPIELLRKAVEQLPEVTG